MNRKDISRFAIEERSAKGTIQRICLDNVQNISLDSNEDFLVIDAEPYKLCIKVIKS